MENSAGSLLRIGAGLRNALAVLAASAALASAFGLSLGLRRIESKTSHQQPTPEAWFEAPTPSSPALISKGRALFLSSCAHCHGADATGDEGPDLHDVDVSDRYISNIITFGIKHEMPSFKKKLGRDEIVRLTAYIRSLDDGARPSSGLDPATATFR
jgi:mono/diheme cytochrome c family protein